MGNDSTASTVIRTDATDQNRGAIAPGGTTLAPRAPRFPIHATLHYRRSGGQDWIESQTINISRSGLLFHANTPLEPKTPVEMQILFPSEITGGNPTNVVCWGTVVRAEPASAPDMHPSMAATIVQYRFDI
jgi:hypothetical protein